MFSTNLGGLDSGDGGAGDDDGVDGGAGDDDAIPPQSPVLNT